MTPLLCHCDGAFYATEAVLFLAIGEMRTSTAEELRLAMAVPFWKKASYALGLTRNGDRLDKETEE
jgi:hypothetical protein